MDENFGVALLNNTYVITLIAIMIIGLVGTFLIGIKKGWWSFKRKDTEFCGKVETVVEEVKEETKEEIKENTKIRDQRWRNILARQFYLIQELDEKKVAIRHTYLVRQLGFVDDTFESKKYEFILMLAGKNDRTAEATQLAEFKFEATYHTTKREIIQMIKENHLLESTLDELKEKMKKIAKRNTDYFKKEYAVSYPIKIDEKFVEEYTNFVDRESEKAIVNAYNLAKQREEQLTALQKEYKSELDKIIKYELPDTN